jgi:hypothetical protein
MTGRETGSGLDPALLTAYRETDFRVTGPVAFTLRVGTVSAGLAALHRQLGVTSSAFVTACNPFSAALTDDENAARLEALRTELRRRQLPFLEGEGQHPGNAWPAEASVLVLGVSRGEAGELGRQFEQNAVVWVGPDAIPQLLVLR